MLQVAGVTIKPAPLAMERVPRKRWRPVADSTKFYKWLAFLCTLFAIFGDAAAKNCSVDIGDLVL
jgi:hypothetical protein